MTELEDPVLTALLHRMFLPAEQRDAKKADDAAERFKTPLAVLNGALADKEYLAGKTFTVADLNVAAVLAWAPLGGLDLERAPDAKAWHARCTSRPAYLQLVQKLG
jgi:glutathione S-transferase